MLGAAQWALDVAVLLLLAATLFYALRLLRALGVLSRDRPALEALVGAFNASTQQAENGIERLRAAAEGAGRTVARQHDAALALKDDLVFLVERGERLANRLDLLLRAAPAAAASTSTQPMLPHSVPAYAEPVATGSAHAVAPPPARVRSQAERDLLVALRTVR